MRRAIRSALVLVGMSIALGASPVRADGFWTFDEQWWKDALAKPGAINPRALASTEAFVPTARISVLKSAYSFLDDYGPL